MLWSTGSSRRSSINGGIAPGRMETATTISNSADAPAFPPLPPSWKVSVSMLPTTPGLLITGTDTGVGKTFVTVMIAEQLRQAGIVVGTYKPACSGSVETSTGAVWEDVERLFQATGGSIARDRICPQRFHAPLAPPVAARRENRAVDAAHLREGAGWFDGRCDLLLVEGVGGLLCPLTTTTTVADLAVELDLPVLIVARAGLGTINHTLLTVEAARSRDLRIAGVVLNACDGPVDDGAAASNAEEIVHRSGVEILGAVEYGRPARLLRPSAGEKIDWRCLADRPRTWRQPAAAVSH